LRDKKSLFELLFVDFSPRRNLDSALNQRARQFADAAISAETQLLAARVSLHKVEARVAALENDVGFLTLALGVLIQALEDKSVVNKDELRKKLESMDGVSDGRLDVNLLRKKLHISPD